jgi:hypothetical protein
VLHYLHRETKRLPDPTHPLALVAAIHPQVLQAWRVFMYVPQELLASIPIRDVCEPNQHLQQQPFCVDQGMTFAAFDLFAAVISSYPPF